MIRRLEVPQIYVAVAVIVIFIIPLRLPLPTVVMLGGCGVVALSVVAYVMATGEFVRAKMPPWPGRTPEVLITDGIYIRSRNPMYFADALFVLGIGLILGAPLALLLAPVLLAVLQARFVKSEELRLSEAFPREWKAYSNRTRRWV